MTVAVGQLVGVTGGSGLPAGLVDAVGFAVGVPALGTGVGAGGFGVDWEVDLPERAEALADFAEALADRDAFRDARAAARVAAFELSAELAVGDACDDEPEGSADVEGEPE